MNDEYQQRYLDHQANKAKGFDFTSDCTFPACNEFDVIFTDRRSVRMFTDEKISIEDVNFILRELQFCPSSCNRQAIKIKTISDKTQIEEISDLLVGGKIWLKQANRVMLVFADMEAYKSPNEIDFMPYLDGGVHLLGITLIARSLGIASCIVNPNIREENKDKFKQYNPKEYRLCGAVALGYPRFIPKMPTRKEFSNFIY